MKITAAVCHEKGADFQIESVELAPPKRDEVLLRIVATGICHTDQLVRNMDMVPFPAVLGHEGAGIVETVGENVTEFQAGDHVILTYATCGECEFCKKAMPYVCDEYIPLNTSGWMRDGSSRITQDQKPLANFFGQGSFANYAVVNKHNLVKADPDLDLTLLGPLGCGFQTGAGCVFGYLDVQPDTSIAIFGMGGVSFSALLAAKVRGCKHIIAVGGTQEKLDLALELGATEVINRKKTPDVVGEIMKITGRGTDYAFESSGAQSMIDWAIQSAGPMGKVALVGGTLGDITINPSQMLFHCVTVGSVSEGAIDPHAFVPEVTRYIKEGKFPIEKLITFYKLEEINQAFEDQSKGRVIKPVLLMPEEKHKEIHLPRVS